MGMCDSQARAALDAGPEELWRLLKGRHPDVVSQALLNRNLTEEMALFIAKDRRTSQEILGFLAGDVRFRNSYPLKVAICKNPKTPQRVALSLLKFMKIFDLSDIAKDQLLNINIRRKVEHIFSERIPTMPLGIKTALAKRASCNVLLSLIADGDERVIRVCLDNGLITEGHLSTMINRPTAGRSLIRLIAEHVKWSMRYSVKYALIRNFHTPMPLVEKFLRDMKIGDLRDLYADPKIPASTRPFVFRELRDRGEACEEVEVTYSLRWDDDRHLPET